MTDELEKKLARFKRAAKIASNGGRTKLTFVMGMGEEFGYFEILRLEKLLLKEGFTVEETYTELTGTPQYEVSWEGKELK